MDSFEENQRQIRELLESVPELNSSELGDNSSDISDVDEADIIKNCDNVSDSEESITDIPQDEYQLDLSTQSRVNVANPLCNNRNLFIDPIVQGDLSYTEVFADSQRGSVDLGKKQATIVCNQASTSTASTSNQEPSAGTSSQESINDARNHECATVTNPTYKGKVTKNKPNPVIWSSQPQQTSSHRTRGHNIVTQLPGPVREAKNAKSEKECWMLFFPDSVIDKLVTYTNKKINAVQANYKRVRDAKETDRAEMKALIGLLYLSGVCNSGNQNTLDLWRSDGLGVEIFRISMGVNRFKFLLQNLRFDDIDSDDRPLRKSQDKLYCFRELFEEFVRRCKHHYSHGEYVTLDEMLPNFRGKCSFRVYMPKKPGKFGIKVWALTDAKTFYTSNLEVFIGNQPKGPFYLNKTTRAVVNRMVSNIEYTGRNVTCDNFFTSVPIARDLLQKKLTLVGTIRKDKTEIPVELATEDPDCERPLKSSMFAFTKTETLVSYKPKAKKIVLALSTFHGTDEIDEETGDECKPAIITFYNKTKCGVDVSDAMQKQYSVSRISNRWPLTMFYFTLNVGGVNSYVIFKANDSGSENRPLPRRNFLMNLGKQLLEEHAQRRVAEDMHLPRAMKDRLTEIFHLRGIQGNPPAQPAQRDQRGNYAVCGVCPRRKNRKTTVSCNSCQTPICKEHTVASCTRCSEMGMEVDME